MHHPTALTLPGGVLHAGHRGRVATAQGAEQPAGLARGRAVHGTQHGHLGVRPVAAEPVVGQRGVQILVGRDPLQRSISGDRGQHPGLQLGGVGDDQPVAGIGDHGLAQRARDLQRTAAPGRPPPGDHRPGQVLRVEPAVARPFVQPVPAVRGVHPGQFLVGAAPAATAGWSSSLITHDRVLSISNPARRNAARRSTAESGFTANPKACVDLCGELGQPRRPLAGPGPRAEHVGQQVQMDVDPPRQARHDPSRPRPARMPTPPPAADPAPGRRRCAGADRSARRATPRSGRRRPAGRLGPVRLEQRRVARGDRRVRIRPAPGRRWPWRAPRRRSSARRTGPPGRAESARSGKCRGTGRPGRRREQRRIHRSCCVPEPSVALADPARPARRRVSTPIPRPAISPDSVSSCSW